MSKYISRININTFKGIKSLIVNDLSRINIIVGDNNIGKTSVLEAIQILNKPDDFNHIISISKLRDIPFYKRSGQFENFMNLFNKNDETPEIDISATIEGKNSDFKSYLHVHLEGTVQEVIVDFGEEAYRRRVEVYKKYGDEVLIENKTKQFIGKMLSFIDNKVYYEETVKFDDLINVAGRVLKKDQFIKMHYLASTDYILKNNIDSIIRSEKYQRLCIEILKLFDKDINYVLLAGSEYGRPKEYIRNKKKGLMPLSSYGDGIKKVLSVANAIAKANNGILLIDEIDTSLHSKHYDEIFRFVLTASKIYNVQLFITTHSIEALDGLLKSYEYDNTDEDEIRVITIRRDEQIDKIFTRVLKGRNVLENRKNFDFEVRV